MLASEFSKVGDTRAALTGRHEVLVHSPEDTAVHEPNRAGYQRSVTGCLGCLLDGNRGYRLASRKDRANVAKNDSTFARARAGAAFAWVAPQRMEEGRHNTEHRLTDLTDVQS